MSKGRPPYWTERRLVEWRARTVDKYDRIAERFMQDAARLEQFGIPENSEALRDIAKLLYGLQWTQLPSAASANRPLQ